MSERMEQEEIRGLENVVVARTRLSRIDGESGTLIIAGHRVEVLAQEHSFEAACHLLWHGELPDGPTLETLRGNLGRRRLHVHRRLAEGDVAVLRDPMDALRAALAGLESAGDALDDAATVIAAVPVAVARWWRRRAGLEPLAPRPDLSTAEDYLRMVTGQAPDGVRGRPRVRALERYLVTVSDHGMNASTFTARVIASTRSDLISAVVGAVGALKGPLHGGAPGPVLDMLDAIGEPARAVAWLRGELEAGRRIMGMGHRVYRVRDPRAAVFEAALAELAESGGGGPRLALARAVEDSAETLLAARHPERALKANVEFYTAVLLEAVGLPRPLFSTTFAVGRAAGWTAHTMEQQREDKLIRPRALYVGPVPA